MEEGRGEEVGCQGPPARLTSLDIPVSPESYYSSYLPQPINLILTSVLIPPAKSKSQLPSKSLNLFYLLALTPLKP